MSILKWRKRVIEEQPGGQRLIAEEVVQGNAEDVMRWQVVGQVLAGLGLEPGQVLAQLTAGSAVSPAAVNRCVAERLGGPAGVEMMSQLCIHRDLYDTFPVEHGPDCRWCAEAWESNRGSSGRMARQQAKTWREPSCPRCHPVAVRA